jgi:hypothetical protein
VTRSGWRPASGERSVRFSPAWFRLLDDVSGREPVERVRVHLDRREGGDWLPTGLAAYVSSNGSVAFPGLERRRDVVGVPPRQYRIRIEADFYRPLYQGLADGVEFDVLPHNDSTIPPPPVRRDVVLLPSVVYPYPSHVRPLRGVVVDLVGDPVEHALVETLTPIGPLTRRERTLTDDRGAFALALRWVASGTTASVTATHQRTGRGGAATVTVPDDLDHSQRIPIS